MPWILVVTNAYSLSYVGDGSGNRRESRPSNRKFKFGLVLVPRANSGHHEMTDNG